MKYLIVLLSFSFLSFLHAQTTGWKQLPGPVSGSIRDVEVAKNGMVFVEMNGRVYRRDPVTSNWLLCKSPSYSPSYDTPSFGIDINGAHYMYIHSTSLSGQTTTVHGIYRSTDDGKSWTQVLSKQPIGFLGLSPSGQLYAVTYYYGSSSIFRSEDNGITWDSIASFPFQTVDFLLGANNKCYFSLYASEPTILQYDPSSSLFKSLRVSDSVLPSGYNVFLCNSKGTPFIRFSTVGYILKPDNTFERRGNLEPAAVSTQGVISSPDGTLYTISNVKTGGYEISYSRDLGYSWDIFPSHPLLDYWYATRMALDSSGNFYIGGTSGSALFRTSDKGNTWQTIGVANANATLLQKGPDNTVFIGQDYYNRYISSDGGLSWSSPSDLPDGYYGVFGERKDGSYFYFDEEDLSSGGTRLWYADKSAPFNFVQQAGLNTYIPSATAEYGNRFYIVAYYPASSLLFTTDVGVNWMGLDIPVTGTDLHSVAINSGGSIYLGYAPSLFRSDDQEQTWTAIATGIKNASITAIKFVDTKTIILATMGSGMWHSIDGGLSWSRWDPNMCDSINTIELFGGKCYAASMNGIISCSFNSNNWQHELFTDEGLPVLTLMNYNDKRLYASVGNLGIWTNDPDLRSVHKTDPLNKKISVLIDPLSNSTVILLNLSATEHVVLDVYDILGHKVMGLANDLFAPGEHRIQVKSTLASGIYTILLRTERGSETEKIAITH